MMCLILALTQRDDSRNNISYIAKNDLVVDGREIVITFASMFVYFDDFGANTAKRKKERKTFRERLPRHFLQYNLICFSKHLGELRKHEN